MDYKLEVTVFNLESCMISMSAGADRIELCDNDTDGGTTASYGLIRAARKLLSIGLFPIIRPRGGDFLYNDAEFEAMQTDVQMCRELGCDGVVTGILRADGTVDKERCNKLVEIAYPLSVTFHRAFDRTNNPFTAMEDVIAIGCERILTSGLRPSAWEGADLIAALIKQAGDRIVVMPGGGVRSNNVVALAQKTGAACFHTSAKIVQQSGMHYINNAMREDLQATSVDYHEVRKIVAALKKL